MAEQLPVDYKQQYPTATKIENGIAYDVSGKQLGPVKGMESDRESDQSQTPIDQMGGWKTQTPQAADSMGGWKVADPKQATAQSTDMGGWKVVGQSNLPPSTISANKPGVFERLKNVVTEGIPAFSSRTVYNPKYGQEQLLSPEEALTPSEQAKHPILTGTLEFAGGLTSPESIGVMASTAGLGTLAGPEATAAAKVIPRLISAGFSTQQIIGAAKESKEAWDAIKRGDESEALRLITHATLSAGTAVLAGQHAAGREATPSTTVGRLADRGVQRTIDAVRPDKAALDSAQKRHAIAVVAHDARLSEADVATKQMEQAGQKLDIAQQNLQDGTGTQAEVDAARTNLSKAVANANKAAKAVDESHTNQVTARGDIDRLNRNIQRTQTKTDAKKQARDNAAHEDFKHVAPNASDEDLDRSRAYLEEYHATVEPVKKENGVQTVYDALGWAKRKIQNTIDPYIQRYGKDSIITNPISDVHDKLAENPNANFAEKGLSYLEENYPQLITGELNVEDAQKLVTQVNAENQATLNPPNRTGLHVKVSNLLKTDPEFAARYHAAASLREGMWGLFEDKGINGIDELRRDERAVINVENDVRRNLNKGDVAVRGSGKSGILRRIGASVLRRGGEAAGAYVGAEAFGRPAEGAVLGGYAGEKLGKQVLPGDKTRNELLERSFKQSGVGRPMSRISGTGLPSTPGVTRPFEPLRLEGLSPEDMRGIQREYSPLHSELAGYFGKGVDDGSYSDFEKDFKDTINDKISRGEKLEPEEKNLRKAISDQDAADALKAREQATKLASLGPAPTATLPEKNPVMNIPNNQNLTPEEIIGHEIAHSIVANKLGIKVTDGVRSHLHASNAADGSHASVGVDLNEFLDDKGKVNVQKLKGRIADIAATFVSGGVYQDLAYNTPFTENHGLNSDLEALQGLMKTVGFTDSQSSQMIAQAAETAGHILSDHLDLIEQHASVREPGLDERYHVSQDRLNQINKDVENAERYRKSARTTGTSEGTGRATAGGREAGVEGRVPEGVRKPGEGTTENKGREGAAGGKLEATRSAASAANVKQTPEESAALTAKLKDLLARTEGGEEATPEEKVELADLLRKSIEQAKAKKVPGELKLGQGGHAGGGVASEEELARPGRFVKISRSGMATDQGKTPDFNLGPGEAGYQVRPGGVYELKAGVETPATKRGVEGYAKELHGKALPTQLNLQKAPKDVVEDEGLVYKGEVSPGTDVHMIEHPGFPGRTAALKGPLTPENVRAKMTSKLAEFGEKEPLPVSLKYSEGEKEGSLLDKWLEEKSGYHPELQAVIKDVRSLTDDPSIVKFRGTFITPDGQFVGLKPGEQHPGLIKRVTGADTFEGGDNRIGFLDRTGTIRTRHMASRGVEALNVSVPKQGVTREQMEALRKAAGQLRNGDMVMERSDINSENANQLSTKKEFVRPSDIEDMLKHIGAHPDSPRKGGFEEVPSTEIPREELDRAYAAYSDKKIGKATLSGLVNGDPKDVAIWRMLEAHPSGGFTVDPRTGEMPRDGYMVETSKTSRTFDHPPTDVEYRRFIQANQAELSKDPTLHIGGWINPQGEYTVALSSRISDRENAVELGKQHNQISIYDLAKGEEIPTGGTDKESPVPTEMKLTPGSSVPLMENPLKVKGTGDEGRVLTTDVARELNKYSRKFHPGLELGKAEPEKQTERARDIAEDEAKYQLAQGKNGKEWYTTEMKDHDDILKRLRPELAEGPRIDVDTPEPHTAKQGLFKAAEAILSSGQKPYGNLKSTIRAWDHYKETGEFSPLNPNTGGSWGPRNMAAYGNAFEYLNDLVKKHGEKGAVEWLLNEHPISELRKVNEDVKGKRDETVPGALVLGPKRGPFMQNLHGIESAFTADRWVSRTWNRWMGTLDPTERGGLVGDYVMDRPRNNTERSLMKESFQEAAKQTGLSTSSLQAVLWYYEQALYSAHGVPKESWSFADAARRVEKEEAERQGAEEFPFGESKETPQQAGMRALMEKTIRPSTFVNLKGNK